MVLRHGASNAQGACVLIRIAVDKVNASVSFLIPEVHERSRYGLVHDYRFLGSVAIIFTFCSLTASDVDIVSWHYTCKYNTTRHFLNCERLQVSLVIFPNDASIYYCKD